MTELMDDKMQNSPCSCTSYVGPGAVYAVDMASLASSADISCRPNISCSLQFTTQHQQNKIHDATTTGEICAFWLARHSEAQL
jgi:hypothetical protein